MPENRNKQGAPVDESLIDRVINGVKYVVAGVKPGTWFGPSQPIAPIAQEAEGRQTDYQVGYNLKIIPRQEEAISFDQLRALASNLPILTSVIETRKDQMVKLPTDIVPNEDVLTEKEIDARRDELDLEIRELKRFFLFPDREHDYQTWFRMVLDDLFIIDAPAIYPRKNKGGGVYALEPMDGALFKRVINADGRTPQAPSVAYTQALHGLPAVHYSMDELIYKPRNPRTWKIYGYSPVEQIVFLVNMALRRELHKLEYYTSGTLPDALVSCPENWTARQVSQFQKDFDDLLSGNLAERRKVRFVAGNVAIHEFKEAILKDDFDEWIARVVCYVFSVSNLPFIKQTNRSVSQNIHQMALQEGLMPLKQWSMDFHNLIIWKYMQKQHLKFIYTDEDDVDQEVQSRMDLEDIKVGVQTIDDIRVSRGLKPYENGIGSKPMIYTGGGAVLLEDVISGKANMQQNPAFGQVTDLTEKPKLLEHKNGNGNGNGKDKLTDSEIKKEFNKLYKVKKKPLSLGGKTYYRPNRNSRE